MKPTTKKVAMSATKQKIEPQPQASPRIRKTVTAGSPQLLVGAILLLVLGATAPAQSPPEDPHGILRKPIPDKLVVLTFDDGPASGYTVVAPILKSFGFGGSFYICDFDSFRTRKDWYLTWRQMKAMSDQGLEIGNHTTGHAGGCGIGPFLSMEDDLVANGVPKPTTIAWPLCVVNTSTYPDLVAAGYTFGRGGHFRPYRPTVDNPFDIPCMGVSTLEEFVKNVRQAAGGKIVTLCYHGVPDMEHTAVSLDPVVFKAQMQYLKDNNYKAIALRDLAEYIDPAKAAKLPPTVRDYKESGTPVLASEEKPAVPVEIAKPKAEAPAGKKPAIEKAKEVVGPVTPINASQPNVFTWTRAEAGNWGDGSKWSNNLANGSAPVTAGQADYIFHFNQAGAYTVTNDLKEGFLLNQVNLGGPALTISGNRIDFTTNRAAFPLPQINQNSSQGFSIGAPVNLTSNLIIGGTGSGGVSFSGLISGTGGMIINGKNVTILNRTNTFSGGTVINAGGSAYMTGSADKALGTGPITVNDGGYLRLERINATNALILNGGRVHAGNGFGNSWSGVITLNGNTEMTSYTDFVISAAMGGPGGFTHIGGLGAFGPSNSGQITLCGTNTYTGATIVMRGTLRIMKAASLYNGDVTKWTPDRISVYNTASLRLCVGGAGEFTGEQIGVFLKNLAATVNNNGLMGGAVLCLDTSNAKETVAVSSDISDSKGPGGGAFLLKKCGAGTIELAGKNTYTGQTILESGALKVSSLNSCVKGKASSSLGVPTDIEAGEIVIGSGDGECGLIYTGTGETTDRVINLAGKKSTVTFDQSGSGLLKLTSTFVISGHSASKTILLQGDAAGTGEIAGNIFNPYDRAGKATTSVTKSGTGTWTLSGTNTYAGPTTVKQGTLRIASAPGLGERTDVHISEVATLELAFKGEVKIGKLYLDGNEQPAGTYSAVNAPKFIKGTGVLRIR